MTCLEDGCDDNAKARGMCSRHYLRWYRAGGSELVVTPMHKRYPDETERFRAHVDESGGDCWLWTGAIDSNGYGISAWSGRTERAHRVALLVEGVPLLPGEMVCHHCDTRHCVRADHLYVGDAQSNSQDMWQRGRARPGTTMIRPTGTANPAHKLTEEDVRYIRAQNAAGRSARSLGAQLGVSRTAVGYVVNGRTWAHVT